MATKKEDMLPKVDTNLKGVHAKLAAARVALKKTDLKMTGENKYAKYPYFKIRDFLPETLEIFAKLGLHSHYQIAPKVIATEKVTINEQVIEKPIIKLMATLVITDCDTKETDIYEMEVQPLEILKGQNSYQADGARSTYYKRYLYRDAMEIEEEDETEEVAGGPNAVYTKPQSNVPYQYQAPAAQSMSYAPQQPIGYAETSNSMPMEAPVYAPTARDMMNTMENNNPNLGQSVEIGNNDITNIVNSIDTSVDPNAPLSMENKGIVMDLLNKKNLNGFEVIQNFCNENGIAGPEYLLNSHGIQLVDAIEKM